MPSSTTSRGVGSPNCTATSRWRGSAAVARRRPGWALGAGGKMKQDIYKDRFELADWDLAHGSRCFVHIVNSLVGRAVTGQPPPSTPPTAKQYAKAGLPWYAYYDETATPLEGSSA